MLVLVLTSSKVAATYKLCSRVECLQPSNHLFLAWLFGRPIFFLKIFCDFSSFSDSCSIVLFLSITLSHFSLRDPGYSRLATSKHCSTQDQWKGQKTFKACFRVLKYDVYDSINWSQTSSPPIHLLYSLAVLETKKSTYLFHFFSTFYEFNWSTALNWGFQNYKL